MITVTVRPVRLKADERKFIRFQWLPYEGNPYWVPPLLMDRRKLIDRKNNPFYKHAVMELFLAERNGSVVGRIGAIVNDNHNKEHNENIGFFGFFECINDRAVAHALFDAVRNWLAQRNVQALRGPMNPSLNYEVGLLIEGFDDPPTFMMTYNPPYYAELIESYGFVKAHDLFAYIGYKKDLDYQVPRVAQLVERVGEMFQVKTRPMSPKTFQRLIGRLLKVFAIRVLGKA